MRRPRVGPLVVAASSALAAVVAVAQGADPAMSAIRVASPVPDQGPPGAPAPPSPWPTTSCDDLSKLVIGLQRLSHQASASDPRYYEGGRWHYGGPSCPRCTVGPGVAAAALWRATGEEAWRTVAIETMDQAIRDHRYPDGSFGPPARGEGSVDIQTSLLALNLGLVVSILGEDGLDEARRARYVDAVRGAAEFLDRNGNYAWYTNGNIVLANAAVAGMAWRFTGDPRYKALYDRAVEFATAPPQSRWPGKGLQYTTEPTRADGSNGAGYLTEQGGGGVGFDADYTQMQADIASIMVLTIDDARSRRLANLLLNQVLARTDTGSWQIDTSGGTRRQEVGRTIPFTTGALAVMVPRGRLDLRPLVASQMGVLAEVMKGSAEYSDPGLYMAWASQAAPALVSVWGRDPTAGDGQRTVTVGCPAATGPGRAGPIGGR